MNLKKYFRYFVFFVLLSFPLTAFSQATKPLASSHIAFSKDGKVKVSYLPLGASPQDLDTYKIETAMLFYAFAMNKLDSAAQKSLMTQVQKGVSSIATDQGLKRGDLIKNNPVIQAYVKNPVEQNLEIKFSEISGKGNQIEILPQAFPVSALAPAVLYFFQDLTNTLPEGGLRLMVLAMGGMNKWYREIGKASDPNSLIQAPVYALNLAVDIVSKISGKKM